MSFYFLYNFRLTGLLFPTLISACYQVPENVCILEQEISCKLLVAFLQETVAQLQSRDKQTEASKKQSKSK